MSDEFDWNYTGGSAPGFLQDLAPSDLGDNWAFNQPSGWGASDLVDYMPAFSQESMPTFSQGQDATFSPALSSLGQDQSYVPQLMWQTQQEDPWYAGAERAGQDVEKWTRRNPFLTEIGKGVGSLLTGGALAAYGANKQNKLNKKAIQDAKNALLAKQRAHMVATALPDYVRLATRSPTKEAQAWGADQPFAFNQSTNRVMTAATGGKVEGSEPPSIIGFLRYLANNRQIPDTREEKLAKRPQEANVTERIASSLQNRGVDPDKMAQGGLCQACGGRSSHYVKGGTAGQADKIPAMLSDGEYIIPADVVSHLGDGNNAAGAKKLDKMRVGVRKQRNSGGTKLPPKSKDPETYFKGAK
jgi:hypothetical protein